MRPTYVATRIQLHKEHGSDTMYEMGHGYEGIMVVKYYI